MGDPRGRADDDDPTCYGTHVRGLVSIAMLGVLACSSPAGDVPVTIGNAPQCTPGKGGLMEGLRHNVVIRVEVDGATRDLTMPGPMVLPSDWAGREATVRIGVCRDAEAPNPAGKGLCDGVAYAASHEATVGGDGKGLRVEVPTAPIPCIDGSQATFGKGS